VAELNADTKAEHRLPALAVLPNCSEHQNTTEHERRRRRSADGKKKPRSGGNLNEAETYAAMRAKLSICSA
jgi:hypothetical protein